MMMLKLTSNKVQYQETQQIQLKLKKIIIIVL